MRRREQDVATSSTHKVSDVLSAKRIEVRWREVLDELLLADFRVSAAHIEGNKLACRHSENLLSNSDLSLYLEEDAMLPFFRPALMSMSKGHIQLWLLSELLHYLIQVNWIQDQRLRSLKCGTDQTHPDKG
jgi:hypothetical protein